VPSSGWRGSRPRRRWCSTPPPEGHRGLGAAGPGDRPGGPGRLRLTVRSRNVGITLSTADVAGITTDTATFVYGQIAAVRASYTLAEALQNAQPVVDRFTVLLAQDLEKTGELL
jgi:hypothetical protein